MRFKNFVIIPVHPFTHGTKLAKNQGVYWFNIGRKSVALHLVTGFTEVELSI